MSSNLDRFKSDIAKLIKAGESLHLSMQRDSFGKEFEAQLRKQHGNKTGGLLKDLPSFDTEYQRWYSESLALLRQVLPDRVSDFTRHYERPKTRKELTIESYRIEDYLQGLQGHYGAYSEMFVDKRAAIPHFRQQQAILEAAEARFDSSLFDIRHTVQADLLDSELEAAEHLAKSKFYRAAGAVAGVVLERHLGQVCQDHQIQMSKKNPTLGDFNEVLKSSGVIDVPQWRFIQHLTDIRNICDHARTPDPTAEQVADLIDGVAKVVKTIF